MTQKALWLPHNFCRSGEGRPGNTRGCQVTQMVHNNALACYDLTLKYLARSGKAPMLFLKVDLTFAGITIRTALQIVHSSWWWRILHRSKMARISKGYNGGNLFLWLNKKKRKMSQSLGGPTLMPDYISFAWNICHARSRVNSTIWLVDVIDKINLPREEV